MKTKFPLIGLSAGNRCTLSPDETDRDWFHAPTNFEPDRFEALFNYFKKGGWWKPQPYAIVDHDGFYEDGIPKNPVVTEVILP